MTPSEHTTRTEPEDVFDIGIVLAVLRRQYRIIVAGAIVGIFIAILYCLTAQPLYTASAKILLDSATAGLTGQSVQNTDLIFDTGAVDSQVEVLKSEKLAMDVIESLKLREQPEFKSKRLSFFGFLARVSHFIAHPTQFFRTKSAQEESDDWLALAVSRLTSNLSIGRVNRTFVLTVDYTDPSPKGAANIANAFADAYIQDQLDARFSASRTASEWMYVRIEKIKEQSLEADLIVQKFKAQNNLISSDGKLLDEQQLTELNSQFMTSVGQTAMARARNDRIDRIIQSGDMDAAVSEALNNAIINSLRDNYLRVLKNYNELAPQLGDDHLQVIKLKGELEEYRRQIFDELRRISESYKSELDIARAREVSLTSSLKGLVGVTAANNEVMVRLRSLQSEADSLKALYENFLKRYQESVQQQSMPITEARIITRAGIESAPSHPNKKVVINIGMLLGLVGGLGIGLAREMLDRGFRTRRQVQESLGLECIALLEDLSSTENQKPSTRGLRANWDRIYSYLKKQIRYAIGLDVEDNGISRLKIMSYSHRAPMSGFAEGLRAIKISVDLATSEKSGRVIGIISTFPGEGKSTISKNLASLLAEMGKRVLLLDGDLKNHSVSRDLIPDCGIGIVEVLGNPTLLPDALYHEEGTGLDVLPVYARNRILNSSEILASAEMKALLQKAKTSYDYVVVDLPPLGPVVDVKAAAHLFDAFVLIIEWGKTDKASVQASLSTHPAVMEKTLGAVLNKVDGQQIRLYEYYGSYYYRRYSRYYSDYRASN
jgi:succinoglycan biosynthesis transport protein ExoP